MTEDLREEARRLRTREGLSVAQIQQRLGVGRHRVRAWVDDLPKPAWTARPNAKDALRERAVDLRESGGSVDEIAAALGVSKSTAYLWVKHLPLTRRRRTAAARARADGRWAGHRREVAERRARVALDAEEAVGTLGVRELMLIGAVMYWCEGGKEKPWRTQYDLRFMNSDPVLLLLFLRFLETVGIPRGEAVYQVSIHETADADAAARWWIDRLGIPAAAMRRPLIKRHKPTTTRYNTAAGYHGCVLVTVPRSREVYWWIAGVMDALADSGDPPARPDAPMDGR